MPSIRLSPAARAAHRSIRCPQLLDGGVTWHVKPWHSEAVKIHAAVPDSAYEMVLEAEDEGSGGMDVYHAEFAQKNGQWAFVSPIYAGL